MSYTNLTVGSSGEAVKRLQEKLGIEADGQYGSQTKEAVEKYQRANGLQVDGIAGAETQGHMFGNGGSSTADTQVPAIVSSGAQMNTGAPVQAPSYRYDASQDIEYQQALQKLQEVQGSAPVYAGTYDQQLNDIYQKIMNREAFSYDLNGDALWNQYKDQYVQQGQMAMMDTIGQAAALTGGYGNTYAQRVGQQTFQGYLQSLNDKVPELYQLARSMYDAEGDRLTQQYALTGELAADEYGKYQDQQNLWQQDLNRAQAAVDTAYERGQSSWMTAEQLRRQDEETAYSREQDDYAKQQDSYDRLANLISSTGYTPSQEELTAAGMSAGEAAAYAKYYTDQNTAAYTGGDDAGDTGDYDNGDLSENQIKMMQYSLGVTADGQWGEESMNAAYGLDADTAWTLWNQGKLGQSVNDVQVEGNKMLDKDTWTKRRSGLMSAGAYKDDPAIAGFNSYEEYAAAYNAYLNQLYSARFQ